MNRFDLSPQDLDLLSAYLDEQLSPSERQQLQARLQQDPDLRAELEALRQTVAVLQALPLVPAPRNFTLSAADVAPKPRRVLRFPTWVVGVAAAFVIGVIGLGLVLNQTTPINPTQVVAQQSTSTATVTDVASVSATLTPSATPPMTAVASEAESGTNLGGFPFGISTAQGGTANAERASSPGMALPASATPTEALVAPMALDDVPSDAQQGVEPDPESDIDLFSAAAAEPMTPETMMLMPASPAPASMPEAIGFWQVFPEWLLRVWEMLVRAATQ